MANRRDKRATTGVWERRGRKQRPRLKEFQKRLFSQVLGVGAGEVRTSTGKKVAINHAYKGS